MDMRDKEGVTVGRILRIAIAGCGRGRGQIWPATVRKLTDLYELCAMAEPVAERAAENQQRWGVPVYQDLEALLAEESPEVVLAAVPTDAYHVVAGLAARHGVHIISEIPVAPTRPIADFMIGAAAEAGVKIEVAENVYRWASERLKQRIVAAGLLGHIIHARLWYTCGSYHGFNAIRVLLGAEARRVLGHYASLPGPYYMDYVGETIPERAWESAVVEFESGARCLYEMPPAGPRGNVWEIEGTEGALMGDELWLGVGGTYERYPFEWEWTEEGSAKVLDSVRVDTAPPIVWKNPYKCYGVADNDEVARVDILSGFHCAVTEDRPAEYPPERAWRDQGIWIGLRESALSGNRWVDLPLRCVTAFEQMLQAEYLTLYGRPWDDLEGLARTAFPRGGVRWTVGRQL